MKDIEMSTISVGLGSTAALAPTTVTTTLVLTGLTDGMASPGDLLGAYLSNGAKIATYAWGSSPGGSEYGTEATLVIPVEAAGRVLHLTAATRKRAYATSAEVRTLTSILPKPGAILVQSLAPRLQPALKLSAGTDAIIVETA